MKHKRTQIRHCVAHLIYSGPKLGFELNKSEAAFPSALDDLGVPYLLMTAETADLALQLRRHGYKYNGVQYDTAFVVVRDDGAKLIMFERGNPSAPKTPAQFLRMMRRKTVIRNDEDLYKSMKYLKRDIAPHMVAMEGKVVHQTDDGLGFVYTVWMPELERNISVFCPDIPKWLEHLFDGFFNISIEFASQVMNKNMPFGSGLRSTVNMPQAFFKGHGFVRTLNYDLVLYGGKKQLVTEDGYFRFGVMQELHCSAQAHSDIQTVVNIGNASELPDYADIQMAAWGEALSDEPKMVAMLNSMINGMDDRQDKLDAWSLLQLVKAGLPVTKIPFARRKLEFFRQRLLDLFKLRVAYPADVARDRYLIPDWTAIDDDGLFTNNGVLEDAEVCMPGVPKWDVECMLVRRPMANPAEKAFATVVTRPEYWAIDGNTPFMFVSVAFLGELIAKLGGCDWDDSAQAHFCPTTIACAKSITYPVCKVQESDAKEATAATKNYRCAPKKVVSEFNESILDLLIMSILGRTGLGIGPVSNAGIVDVSNVLNGLQANYELTYVMSNLEDLIDATVHVSKNANFSIEKAEKTVRGFNDKLTACSEFLITRVPKRQRDHVATTVETDLDRAVAEIRPMDEAFKARLEQDCWDNLYYPSNLLLIDPSRQARALAREINLAWGQELKNQRERHVLNAVALAAQFDREPNVLELDKAGIAAVKAAEAIVYESFSQTEEIHAAWAVLMKKRWIDDNRLGAGACRDGLLGGNHTVKLTIAVWQMLEQEDGGGMALRHLARPAAVRTVPGVVPVAAQAVTGPVIGKGNTTAWTVVAGWSQKVGDPANEAVVAWRSRMNETIWLGPVDFEGEAAIEAITLDGLHYGWLPKGQIADFLRAHQGHAIHATLAPKADFSMSALVQ